MNEDELVKRFTEQLIECEMSENTIESYTFALSSFLKRYDAVTKANLLLWKKQLMGEGMSPNTVNIRLNALNKFLDFDGRPWEKVKILKIQKGTAVENVISEAEYRKLCDSLKRDGNLRWYFIIRLLATTGARASEAIRLKKSDFDRGYAELWTKGKIRRIYIPHGFISEAASYYAEFAPGQLLVLNHKGKEMSTRSLAGQLQNLAVKYGINKAVMHPHSFRHLYAIEFLKRNNNISLLADLMGHSSVSTTAIYTRLSREQQANAVNQTIEW